MQIQWYFSCRVSTIWRLNKMLTIWYFVYHAFIFYKIAYNVFNEQKRFLKLLQNSHEKNMDFHPFFKAYSVPISFFSVNILFVWTIKKDTFRIHNYNFRIHSGYIYLFFQHFILKIKIKWNMTASTVFL